MNNKKEIIVQILIENKGFEFCLSNGVTFGEKTNLGNLKAIGIILENIKKSKCKVEIVNSTTGKKKYKTIKDIARIESEFKYRGKKYCIAFYNMVFEHDEVKNGKRI